RPHQCLRADDGRKGRRPDPRSWSPFVGWAKARRALREAPCPRCPTSSHVRLVTRSDRVGTARNEIAAYPRRHGPRLCPPYGAGKFLPRLRGRQTGGPSATPPPPSARPARRAPSPPP